MQPVTLLVRPEFLEQYRSRLTDVAPNATFVTFMTHQEMLDALPNVDGLYGGSPGPDILERSGRLKWIHMRRAGVERDEPEKLAAHGITLTKGSGAFDVPIAEHVLAMTLALARGIPKYVRHQASGTWDRDFPHMTLADKVLGVYGVGSIGTEVARKAHLLGMRSFGVTRRNKARPDFMEALWTEERLDDMLGIADVVVMCAALTDQTRARFGAREFELMKPTAYFMNISRGATVVTDDLIAALESGSIGGAGLDVTDPEPLPPDSPLWQFPNVIITPHISGLSDRTERDADDILIENIRRFAAGEPLLNAVDPVAGY